MGAINIKHTGGGSDVTISSDGTSLLLDGTAVGGGGDLITSTSFPSTGFTLTDSDKGKYYHMTGSNQTITLPSSSAISAGWYVFLSLDKNAVYRLDITAASGDTWYSSSTGTYSIYAGNTVLVIYRGNGEWGLIGNDYYMATSAYGGSSRPTAYGARAMAIGAAATASGNYTYAFGKDAYATGLYATAMTRSRAGAASAFAAAIDTNSSSYGATGANSVAIGDQAKATSSDSFAIGNNALATSSNSIALNAYAKAEGFGGNLAIGVYNVSKLTAASSNAPRAEQRGTVAIGAQSVANKNGAWALGESAYGDVQYSWHYSGGRFTGLGDAQSGLFVLRSDTTDATAEALTTTNSTASTDNQIILPNNSAYSFSGTIIAREDATDGSDYASWEIKGALLRDANAASTVLGNGIVNKLYATSGASAWAVALSADTTNGGLKVEVTGAAATNIRWVATINTSEVTYA